MFAPASPSAPHNVARYANSLRPDQLDTRTFNAVMAVSPLSSTFSTMWLTALTFIAPGEEILCDYGDNYALPTLSPATATPLALSNDDATISLQLSYTSTGTLIDSSLTPARTRQRSHQHLSATQRLQLSAQSSAGDDLSAADHADIWEDAELTNTTAAQHEVHLHPAGHGYSSDASGDGPTPERPTTHLLALDLSTLRLAEQDAAAPSPMRNTAADIVIDLAVPALRKLATAATARNGALSTAEIAHLLTDEPPLVISQRDERQCFSNTQGRGYCGYIVILQLYLQHYHSWLAYPHLEHMVWRNALATLLDHLQHLPTSVPRILQPECAMLCDKARYISQRLRSGANDRGVLNHEHWLSCDEVICALTLLGIPSALWMHSDALRVDSTLPLNSLILMQTAPDCQLATPLYHLPSAVTLLPRLHFAHAHSHFYVLPRATAVSEYDAHQLVQRTLHRCSQLSIAQLTWLCDDASDASASLCAPATPPPSSSTLSCSPISSSPHIVLPAPPAPPPVSPLSTTSNVFASLNPAPAQRCSSASSLQPPPPSSDLSMPPITPPIATPARRTRVPRPSRRRKHKRRARAAAAHEQTRTGDDSSLGPPLATIQPHQHITVVYWNTNGHLTQHSAWTTVQLIRHLSADVCVLLDTRLNATAGQYHAAAIKHFIPGSAVALHNTSRHSTKTAGGARMQTMGGAMYILAPRCAHNLRHSHSDGSNLGVAGYITLAFPSATYHISHGYVPPPAQATDGPATLNQRLRAHLAARGLTISPQLYVLRQLTNWITAARSRDVHIITGGDFNMDPTTPRGLTLQHWAQNLALTNLSDQHSASSPPKTHMLGGIPRSRIDHIYADFNCQATLACVDVLYEPLAAACSDHCPIYASFRCPTIGSPTRPLPKPPPSSRLELPHRNSNILAHYQEELDAWTSRHAPTSDSIDPRQAAALLGATMGATINVTAKLTARRRSLQRRIGHRSRFKDGYSPLYCALKAALLILLDLQRNLYHARRTCSSAAADVTPLCRYMSQTHNWQRKYTSQSLPTLQRPTLQTANDILRHFRTSALCTRQLADRIASLRNLMHGRRRTDWRKQHSQRIALLEDMRSAQQYKLLFRRIGIKDRTAISLDTLCTTDTTLTNATEIHLALTAHFASWYQAPQDTHPFAQQLHDPAWIAALLDGTANPLPHLPASFCQHSFITACRTRVTEEQRRQVQDATDAPLAWSEYMAEIHLLCHGKAPGPSGVTATMIKSWPDATHQLVFSCLRSLWRHRSVSNWWLHSYLHPIPKKGAATLDNLRPLGQYEITRKLLAAIIIKRAYRIWEQLKLLHPHQHAYRRGMGTGTAILRLLNLIEDSTESDLPLLVTAWDIKRQRQRWKCRLR